MALPFGMGRLDWSEWVLGLIAAFISGGATAVTSGVVASIDSPDRYSIGTGKFYHLVISVFLVSGILSAMSFLRAKPVPEERIVTHVVEVTEQHGTHPTTVTTDSESHIEKA